MRISRLLTILFLIISLVLSACAPTFSPQTTSPPLTPLPNQQPPIPDLPQAPQLAPTVTEASVTRVIDGDTIEVSIKGSSYTVRYIGVDTPETVHPEKPVEYFGKEASDMNKELVAGKTVRLEKDLSETDKYGRLLRYVYVGDLFVNAELVRLGYAQVATYPPDVKYADLFLRLQREAKDAGRGLWGASTTPQITSPPSVALPLKIVSVTSPVRAGSKATLVAETLAGAICSITVYYKSGPSSAAGLEAKSADSSGRVSWTWTVGSRTTPGTWRIVVATGPVSAETTFIVQ